MSDLIDIAKKELGYKASESNTKYGKWYGTQGPWCAMFVSWCANQAKVGTSIVPKFAYVPSGMSWYKDKGRYKARGAYTPKRNDIVFFGGGSHVGIVESVSGTTLNTIEGNTTNSVARRQYTLSNSYVTGYGLVSQYIGNDSQSASSSDSKSEQKKKNAEEELKYLKQVLALQEQLDKQSNQEVKEYEISSVKIHKVEVQLIVQHNGKYYDMPVQDGMKVVWERKNAPGKLTFTTIQDSKRKIYNGDSVTLKINGSNFFMGFIFVLKPQKDGLLDVTVYDQLRYFKNKDTYIYSKKTTTQLVRMIAKDFGLQTGTLANTKKAFSRVDDDMSLFDIVENSLDETLMTTGKIYTLYDEFGKLRLREPWKVNVLIDAQTGQEYTYTRSIDDGVYNQIKLAYENTDTGTLELYVSKSSKSINKWGLLQYFEKIDDPMVAKLKGKVLLKLYNKVARTLKVTGAFGSTKVRAGCLLPVLLTIYDVKVSNYLLVDKVTHEFSNNQHTMDLELSGGDFDSSY